MEHEVRVFENQADLGARCDAEFLGQELQLVRHSLDGQGIAQGGFG